MKKVERDDLDLSDDDQPLGDIRPDDNLPSGPDFNNIEPRESQEAQYRKESVSSDKQFEGGDEISPSGRRYKEVEEVTFPSLDEALKMNFDLNNVTNIQ